MNVDIHTLAGAYAVDAVDDLERRAFDRHLAECEACEIEIGELRETLGRVAASSSMPPPPRLKATVMAQISRTRQTGPGRASTGGAGASRARRWSVAAAAAVVIAAGAGAAGYTIERPTAQANTEAKVIAEVMKATDRRVTVFNSPRYGGNVTVVTSASLNEGVALATDLNAPPEGLSYNLWVIRDQPVNAGALAAGATSGTEVLQNVVGAQKFGISLETGQAAQPTQNTTETFDFT